MIHPDWQAPASVRALVTTRPFGDLSRDDARQKLRGLLPAEPRWLRQVHAKRIIDLDGKENDLQADGSVTRSVGTVCAVLIADCMPVLFCDEAGTTVALAHAGWRGLAAGVLEATVDAMGVSPQKQLAWLGPAIGPQVYEVGDEVRAAFRGHEGAFRQARPGHWLLDLYAVARRKLQACGVTRVTGGGFCTYSDAERFFSFRRDGTAGRMAALIWLT